jgi:hypothetical protein
MTNDNLIEEIVDNCAKQYEAKTGQRLSLMRKGKIASELFWAMSKKD